MKKLLIGLFSLILFTFFAKEANAIAIVGDADLASVIAYASCREGGGSFWKCAGIAAIVDPPAIGVTNISQSLQYDSSLLKFNAQKSGFLGQFSENGDTPPTENLIGTVPLGLLPNTGYTPGNPITGSTFSLTDTGSVVSLNYQLPSPVTVNGDVNFFLYYFDLIEPQLIDLSKSTITYSATEQGSLFTQTNFVCTAADGKGCGSSHPITGVSINLFPVPEPSSMTLGLISLAGAAGLRRRNKRLV